MPSVCPTLEKANDRGGGRDKGGRRAGERRRAWRELQAIRKLLALVVDDLPPPPKPASFEAEGALLRAALAKAIHKPWHVVENLEAAIEALRPYLANSNSDGNYPRLLQNLNRAVNRDRPDLKALARLCESHKVQSPN